MSAIGRRLLRRETRDLHSSAMVPAPTDGANYRPGYPVSTETALRLSAVYACVSLIANGLSTMPVDAYRKRDGRRVPVTPSPSLILKPLAGMLQVEWVFSALTSLLLRGNLYGYKFDFDSLGYPRQILLIHPDDASVRRQPGGIEYRFNGEVQRPERVWHVKGFTMPGWIEGLSVVAHHAMSIGVGLSASQYGGDFYADPHPTAALETEQQVDEAGATRLKARVRQAVRDGGPLVLGAGTKWKPLTVPPHESLFLEAQRYTATDIARIFLVPPEKIGAAVEGGSSVTYGNREANVIEFQSDALLPWAVRLEQALTALLPAPQFVKFNMDASIRVDLTNRYKAHEIGIRAGFLLRDEARELEDREPLTAEQKAEVAGPSVPPAPLPEESDDE